jgi:hypothetical protein
LVLVALLLPLQDSFPPLLQNPASKKNTTIRQASICPICVRASQQLEPHFLFLALSLYSANEVSDLV